MSYLVLTHWTSSGLASKVQSYIEKGYEPVGNATVAMTDTYAEKGLETEYVQAVQKKD
jgi:hypothetical protein